MNIRNFVLSYYENSTENFHIQKLNKVTEAQKPHTHEYFQIYFISKGSLEHNVENESAHLNQGDMFIIPPGVTHYILRHTTPYFTLFRLWRNCFLTSIRTTSLQEISFVRCKQTKTYM